MPQVQAYAAQSATTPLAPLSINRREVTPNDIEIDIFYCGVCHSDIHMARDEWGMNSIYPMVPGHEIVGRVTNVGNQVSGFKKDDLVGVGVLVDSCRECQSCKDDLEQYCENGSTPTYGAEDKRHGGITYGGYSKQIVVDKAFVLSVPENIDTKAVAPLLCAGITTWSPLRHWNVSKGMQVGIIGLGGLGHMGVKFAKALGAEVTMITTSESKGKDAVKLGADHVLLSKDPKQMEAFKSRFDFLLNTVPVSHDVNPYVPLLKRDGTMAMVGAIEQLEPGVDSAQLIFGRKSIAGSLIGGLKETQEMLDFCGEHNIVSEVEMIKMQEINQAYTRMIKGDVKYRFVIDMTSL
ncbi:NAD(P)-dependent alcohol dehydrogenase [Francisellaceae bacterium]|nr:NAD(P)-dependent alcohol dehydrogenase [Francisellaceae bacterium]